MKVAGAYEYTPLGSSNGGRISIDDVTLSVVKLKDDANRRVKQKHTEEVNEYLKAVTPESLAKALSEMLLYNANSIILFVGPMRDAIDYDIVTRTPIAQLDVFHDQLSSIDHKDTSKMNLCIIEIGRSILPTGFNISSSTPPLLKHRLTLYRELYSIYNGTISLPYGACCVPEDPCVNYAFQ